MNSSRFPALALAHRPDLLEALDGLVLAERYAHEHERRVYRTALDAGVWFS